LFSIAQRNDRDGVVLRCARRCIERRLFVMPLLPTAREHNKNLTEKKSERNEFIAQLIESFASRIDTFN